MRGGLVHEPFALQDPEAVLFVNGHKTEPREFHVVLDERMSADDELRFTGANALEGRGFLRTLQATDQQFHAITRAREDTPRGKKVLYGEDFRWGHQRRLRAILDGNHRRL